MLIILCKNRQNEILKTAWTDIIYEFMNIYYRKQIPYAVYYKNVKISCIPDNIFLKIKKRCRM